MLFVCVGTKSSNQTCEAVTMGHKSLCDSGPI